MSYHYHLTPYSLTPVVTYSEEAIEWYIQNIGDNG